MAVMVRMLIITVKMLFLIIVIIVQLVSLCKDNANRRQNKMNLFIFYAEMQLILSKDHANRRQNTILSLSGQNLQNLFIFYAEMQ